METLMPFLKHSSVLDLLILLLIILIALILIPVGIWIAIAARTRKAIYFFLMLALLPLFLGLFGTALRFIKTERVLARYPGVGAEVIAEVNRENWIITYVGMVGTAVPVLIGVLGVTFKKEKEPELSLKSPPTT